ncbi:NUDIX domain-containing protein [Novosphingobium sp.]|uniref:NUDIX domain-containing protein n=1 Tax=Novosphingobium sp. TaxID=1874826 RepID=UPI0028AD56A0|nr:NUDIX domain-containing protein [Novosphingobium sp.]
MKLVEREAVRAILLNNDNQVLLIKVRSPEGDVFWVAPGGGVETGETAERALKRELDEELGTRTWDVGPLVWLRHHTFSWKDRRLSQYERYYIVSTDRFEAAMLDDGEAAHVTELRWWNIKDLASAAERITPLSLSEIVHQFLANGAPYPLPPVEVLID